MKGAMPSEERGQGNRFKFFLNYRERRSKSKLVMRKNNPRDFTSPPGPLSIVMERGS